MKAPAKCISVGVYVDVTCAVTLLSGSQYSAWLLILSLSVIWESVYALIATGVCVRVGVVDHHVVRRN